MTDCNDPLDLFCYWQGGDYISIALYLLSELSVAYLIQELIHICKQPYILIYVTYSKMRSQASSKFFSGSSHDCLLEFPIWYCHEPDWNGRRFSEADVSLSIGSVYRHHHGAYIDVVLRVVF